MTSPDPSERDPLAVLRAAPAKPYRHEADPPAVTAGEEDHSDPWALAGDEADAPEDPS